MSAMTGENVPAFRFPEFKDEWKRRRFRDVMTRASTPVQVDPNREYREIGIRSHGRGVFHKDPIKGKTLGDKRVFDVVPGSLAFNIVFAWEQAVALLTDDDAGFIASHRFQCTSAERYSHTPDSFESFFLGHAESSCLDWHRQGVLVGTRLWGKKT